MTRFRLCVSALVLSLALLGLPLGAEELARVHHSPQQVQFEPQGSYERLVLTVSMPGGEVVRRELAGGQAPTFVLPQGAADGSYVYELRAMPPLDAETRQALAASRGQGGQAAAAAVERLRKAGRLPAGELVQSGTFRVADGSVVSPEAREPRQAAAKAPGA